MTLADFINSQTGHYVDFDKGGTYECVDLVREYLVKVLGIPGYTLHALGTSGGAKDMYNKFTEVNSFERIVNTPSNVPLPGDIIVFKTSTWIPFIYGAKGHVGIVVSANVKNVSLFSQNYPTGSSPKIISSNYKDCLGWLHKK